MYSTKEEVNVVQLIKYGELEESDWESYMKYIQNPSIRNVYYIYSIMTPIHFRSHTKVIIGSIVQCLK